MDKYTAGFSVLSAASIAFAIMIVTIGKSGEYEMQVRTTVEKDVVSTTYWLVHSETKKECNCGTTKNIASIKDSLSDDVCDVECKKAFSPTEKRCALCDGDLCRYGKSSTKRDKDGQPEPCDPDEISCKPWPCVVIVGQSPEVASNNEEIDLSAIREVPK